MHTHVNGLFLTGVQFKFLQQWAGSIAKTNHEKDKVENYLHDQVCSGAMPLSEAQKEIATNWLAVYNRMPPQYQWGSAFSRVYALIKVCV